MKKNNDIDKNYDDCWVYIFVLTTLVIVIQALRSYTFDVFSHSISYGVVLLPGTFFLSHYLLKNYDYKKAVAGVAISAVISVGFHAVLAYILGRGFILTNSCGHFCGYVVSQFLSLLIFQMLRNRAKEDSLLIFLTYCLSIAVYFVFYIFIYLQMIFTDGFWENYFIILVIEFVICIPVVVLDLTKK